MASLVAKAAQLPWLRGKRGAPSSSRLWDVALSLLALGLAYALKRYYSQASPAELRWILAPTAAVISLSTGTQFVYEAGTGYVGREAFTLIVPACAGINFLAIAWSMLVLGFVGTRPGARQKCVWFGLSGLVAFVLTVLSNSLRIVLAIHSHAQRLSLAGLAPADLHRLYGSGIYLTTLWLTYVVAERLLVAPRPLEAALP